MLYRRSWLPVWIIVALFIVGCGSADTASQSASPTPTEFTEAAPTETATADTAASTETTTAETATPDAATPAPTAAATATPAPTAAEVDQPTPLVEELDPMESVQGGNVNQVYPAAEYPPELAGIIAGMIDDAAERSGLAANEIDVVAVADVTWSDASLGCGQPGFAYAQVLTDGMRVVLAVDDLFYDYRASGVDAFFLCSQSATLAGSDALPAASDPDPAAGDAQAGGEDKSSPGLYEITEDGVVQLEPPVYDDEGPTEGTNPPDE